MTTDYAVPLLTEPFAGIKDPHMIHTPAAYTEEAVYVWWGGGGGGEGEGGVRGGEGLATTQKAHLPARD